MQKSLEQNRWKFDNNTVIDLKPYISRDIYDTMLKELYSKYVNKFKLFSKLPLDYIVILKENTNFGDNKNVFKINSICNEM